VWLGFSEVELRRMLGDAGFKDVSTALVHRETEAPHFETILAAGNK
jgi:ArsR family transcriptional regulator